MTQQYADIIIVDEVERIVDSIRSTSPITAFLDNLDGTFTVVTDPKDLVAGKWVSIADSGAIDGVNYEVVSVEIDRFTIRLAAGTAVTDLGTWKANAPYFRYGYEKEVNKIIHENEMTATYKRQNFPLIWLSLGFDENFVTTYPTYVEVDLFIVIMTDVPKTWEAVQSTDENFRPILWPLYREFFVALEENIGKFYFENTTNLERLFPHSRRNHYHYEHDAAEANKFVPCDAVVITSLPLRFRNETIC